MTKHERLTAGIAAERFRWLVGFFRAYPLRKSNRLADTAELLYQDERARQLLESVLRTGLLVLSREARDGIRQAQRRRDQVRREPSPSGTKRAPSPLPFMNIVPILRRAYPQHRPWSAGDAIGRRYVDMLQLPPDSGYLPGEEIPEELRISPPPVRPGSGRPPEDEIEEARRRSFEAQYHDMAEACELLAWLIEKPAAKARRRMGKTERKVKPEIGPASEASGGRMLRADELVAALGIPSYRREAARRRLFREAKKADADGHRVLERADGWPTRYSLPWATEILKDYRKDDRS